MTSTPMRPVPDPDVTASAPLVVACIPWVGTKPAETGDADDEGRTYGRRRRRFVVPDKTRRAVMVWLVALVVFASPLSPRYSHLGPVIHQPVFLIFAPLLFACISLMIPGGVPVRRDVASREPPLSRSRAWSGIAACLVSIAILVGLLIVINDRSLLGGSANALWPDVLYGGCILAALLRIRYLVKLLTTAR